MTPPITEEQLAELERLEREAFCAPWTYQDLFAARNGALIVAARNALPHLIAEVRRLRAIVESYEAAADDRRFLDP